MESISVAIIEGVVPSYRMPYLKKLSACDSLTTVCFHGSGKPGHSVASAGKKLPVSGSPIKNFHWPGGGARIAWQTGLFPILSGRYDVVVCAEAVHNISTWLVLFFSRLSRYTVALSGHGLGAVPRHGFVNRCRMKLRRFLAQRADVLLVYTKAGAADCIDQGVDPRKVFVTGNTLDTEHLISVAEALKVEKDASFQSGDVCGRPTNQPKRMRLLYVGRLYAAKRVDILLHTAKILRQRGTVCRTIIVGDGHQKAELAALAGSDDVEFVGACYDENVLARYFGEADVVVMPDSVGLAVVHAFSNGTPILTSRAGTGHGPEFDYIEDGRNGILVDTLAPADFADKIEMLANNDGLLKALGAEAKTTAQSLSMTNMVVQFVRAMEFAAPPHTGATS